jgi:hypothetical protein
MRHGRGLEAAYIRVQKGADLNKLEKEILLRADNALLDAGLITLTKDGCKVELSKKLSTDGTYDFLKRKRSVATEFGLHPVRLTAA